MPRRDLVERVVGADQRGRGLDLLAQCDRHVRVLLGRFHIAELELEFGDEGVRPSNQTWIARRLHLREVSFKHRNCTHQAIIAKRRIIRHLARENDPGDICSDVFLLRRTLVNYALNRRITTLQLVQFKLRNDFLMPRSTKHSWTGRISKDLIRIAQGDFILAYFVVKQRGGKDAFMADALADNLLAHRHRFLQIAQAATEITTNRRETDDQSSGSILQIGISSLIEQLARKLNALTQLIAIYRHFVDLQVAQLLPLLLRDPPLVRAEPIHQLRKFLGIGTPGRVRLQQQAFV